MIELDSHWLFRADSTNVGTTLEWFKSSTDRTGWREVKVPEYWESYDMPGYDGLGWFVNEFQYSDTLKNVVVFFGGVDDEAEVWLNGTRLGDHVGHEDSFYFEASKAIVTGKNLLVVKVKDNAGPGGIYKPVCIVPANQVKELFRSQYAEMKARKSEEWVKDAVIYEVYLRSFSPEGSFKALERRLPELKELGVNIVWLMPIHPVGELNRKGRLGSPYSISDYYGINPEFGTMDDFKSLVKTTHEQGMKIIIDLVANHASWDSKLLTEHPDWFTKDKEGNIVAPNPDWHDVADLDYEQYELRKAMIAMMTYWVRDIGIDGFRCDVAELVPTDFWERARRQLDDIKPVVMLSEGTLPEHHVRAFDMTYSWTVYDVIWNIINGPGSVRMLDDILERESYRFPQGSLRLRFNTNHDKNAWDAPAVERYTKPGAKATAVLVFTMPGIPLIYNGEEVGNDKRLDLFEKVSIDWSKNPDFLAFYRALGKLRREHKALARGDYRPLPNSDGEKVVSFARSFEGETIVSIVSLANEKRKIAVQLPEGLGIDGTKEYFTGKETKPAGHTLELELPPFGYQVYIFTGK